MLSSCGARRAAFLAHSFGTAVLASIIKRSPGLVAACTLVDPICFKAHTASVAINFLLARPPLSPGTLAHYAQRKLGTEHLTLQDCFRRRFWWAQHWLAPSELKCATRVILSGRDTVACAQDVLRHLEAYQETAGPSTRPRLHIEHHPSWCHGQMFLHLGAQRRAVEQVQRFVSNPRGRASTHTPCPSPA